MSSPSPATYGDENVIHDYEAHINPSLAALMKFVGYDSVEVSAQGCIVRDSRGREFLDCLGGYGTMSVGYSHPRVVNAVREQLERQAFGSRALFSAAQTKLAKKLAEIAPGDLQFTFFCNSGAEAAEAAIKLARLKTGRTKLVSATGSFHGKTMGALSISGRDRYKTPFAPLIPDCVNVPFGDIEALRGAVDERTAALLLEPIQGEGGIIVPPDGYLKAAREICDQNGALLVFDEVQTGLGRTGKMWGADWEGVAPDMMLLAKALSGGCVPIGAVLGTPSVWEVWTENPLIHSSTFGGNPLACAAGFAAIETVETENLVARSQEQGEKLRAAFRGTQDKHPGFVKEVRGRGLMIGIEFGHDDVAGLVIAGLVGRNVLAAYTLNNPTVIRFEPPLVISDAQIAQVTDAFAESVASSAEMLEGIEF